MWTALRGRMGRAGSEALDYLRTRTRWGGSTRLSSATWWRTRPPHRPVVQGPQDPAPGYYVSQTAFEDESVENEHDPRRYVDATKINYVVLGKEARRMGARLGDFVAVYSRRTHRSVFGIVGDYGNPTGTRDRCTCCRRSGYPFHNGKDDAVEHAEIVVRFYPGSNPEHRFFRTQAALDRGCGGAWPEPRVS